MTDVAEPEGRGGVEVALPGFIDDVAAVTRGQHEVAFGNRIHVGEAVPEGVTREFRHVTRVGQRRIE
jgi:hypothetical protein